MRGLEHKPENVITANHIAEITSTYSAEWRYFIITRMNRMGDGLPYLVASSSRTGDKYHAEIRDVYALFCRWTMSEVEYDL